MPAARRSLPAAPAADALRAFLAWWAAEPADDLRRLYVETFDFSRRTAARPDLLHARRPPPARRWRCCPAPPLRRRRASSWRARSCPTTCRWCWSSPRSTPQAGGRAAGRVPARDRAHPPRARARREPLRGRSSRRSAALLPELDATTSAPSCGAWPARARPASRGARALRPARGDARAGAPAPAACAGATPGARDEPRSTCCCGSSCPTPR